MCLPFGPNSNLIQNINPPTSKSRKCKENLKYLMYAQLILGILNIIIDFMDVFDSNFTGLSELFMTLLLYLGYKTINYCSCIVYIFFCSNRIMESGIRYGKPIQNNHTIFDKDDKKRCFGFVVVAVSILYYFIAIYFTFEAYKEFKAVTKETSTNNNLPQNNNNYDGIQPEVQNNFANGGNHPKQEENPYYNDNVNNNNNFYNPPSNIQPRNDDSLIIFTLFKYFIL